MRPASPLRILRIAALPDGFEELAADARADGQRLLEVLREDVAAGTLRFDGPGEGLFAAYAREALLGLAGLTRDPYTREEAVGRVRRLYVRRAARRHGAGRGLVAAIASAAAQAGVARLRVRSPVSAFAFYEACGFLRSVEASATHVRVIALPAAAPPPRCAADC